VDASQTLLIGGKIAFGLAGLAAGAKLVGMARSGQARGPHALAAAAIFVGGSGLVLITVGDRLPSPPLALAGEVLMRLGMLGLCLFLWKVFRPRSPGGPLGTAACTAIMAGALGWDWRMQDPLSAYDGSLPSAMAVQVSIALPFAWSTWETATHWMQSRRRLALGLVDPMVCHRFGLWCTATSAFVGICMLAIAAGVLTASGFATTAAMATGARGVLYLVVVASVWLGLFPPEGYRRRIAGRGTTPA
jgi:hypothetical protein